MPQTNDFLELNSAKTECVVCIRAANRADLKLCDKYRSRQINAINCRKKNTFFFGNSADRSNVKSVFLTCAIPVSMFRRSGIIWTERRQSEKLNI